MMMYHAGETLGKMAEHFCRSRANLIEKLRERAEIPLMR